MIKMCSKCKETKLLGMFCRSKNSKDGYHNQCKACKKDYREANKDKTLKDKKTYREKNREKNRLYAKYYYRANREKCYEGISRRRARKCKAIPKFLRNCEVERKRIRDIFKLRQVISEATGIEHHVDHMWPLSKGGPHWSGNLQILTATENRSKHASVCKLTKKNIKDSLKIAKEEYTNEDSCNGHRDR